MASWSSEFDMRKPRLRLSLMNDGDEKCLRGNTLSFIDRIITFLKSRQRVSSTPMI